MWKIVVAAAAVGIASLAGAVLVGRDVVDPEPLEPTRVAVDELDWPDLASGVCRAGMDRVQTELLGVRPRETNGERAVRLFAVTTAIEGDLVAALERLPVAAGLRHAVAEAVAVLADQHERDVATTAKLRRRFDAELLRREITAYEERATLLRGQFGRLGAAGCVEYLDPTSYE